MEKTKKQKIREEIRKELARRDYLEYLKFSHNDKYKESPHNNLIAKYLDKIEKGEIDRLAVFMPPRHGKSMTISESFPSYYIGKNPSRKVIEVSYGTSLAKKFGRKNRQKLEEYGEELFNIRVSKENSSVTNWGIEKKTKEGWKKQEGQMLSAGIMSGITGEGATLIIIDDPIKNQQEADSTTYRERIYEEWQSTLSTRLEHGGAVILILTRWHEDDLASRLLKEEEWTIINLPAIAEDENDLLNREIGEPLWEDGGYGKEWAEKKKKQVGSRTWNALYQQRPAPQEGSLFKREHWKFYKTIPSNFEQIIQSWDCTFKDTQNSDYVVGQVWGKIGADRYLLDQVRGKMTITETMNSIRSLSSKWNSSYVKLIEDKANGPAIIHMLKKEIQGIIPVNPEGGKVVRAQAISPQIEAGNVYLPSPELANWIHDFIEEASSFPNGKHDDQIDAMTQALNRLMQQTKPFIF